MPLTVTTLPVKKCSGNDRSHFQNTNINIKISAENGQSATATTAACGRNREELLGPRPARCECRPRHEADAGSRNPYRMPEGPQCQYNTCSDPIQQKAPGTATTGGFVF